MFHALRNSMQISLPTAKASIIAMAVLYNIRHKFKDNNPYDADSDEDLDDEEDDHVTMNSEAEPVQHGHNLFRQEFMQQYFS
ncbi:hypothetical protein ACS0PU_004779 [Formica fusca]